MLPFWRKRKVTPVDSLPVEPPTPKPYILAPATIGIPEGIYFVVYQNEFTDEHWCFGTSTEIAIIGRENSTLIFPVDRTFPMEGKWDIENRYYIPRTQNMEWWSIPLSDITPQLIAEAFLRKEPGWGVERPTLWYETNLEKVIWDNYRKGENRPE